MNRAALVTGVGLGAGLMFLLDPQQGTRRRALLRDKLSRVLNKTGDTIGGVSRDVANRARGLAAVARSSMTSAEASDDVIAARVRSKLGRVVSHPGSIAVAVREGTVTLTGPVLESEVDRVINRVESVRGVRQVENHLIVHETAEGVPGLQGFASRTA